MPSRLSLFLQSVAVSTIASIGAFIVYTKHVQWEPFDATTDPTLKTLLYHLPQQSQPYASDSCVRRVPLAKIDHKYLADKDRGGTELAEAFTKGVLGGRGFLWKRALAVAQRSSDEELWSKQQIEQSSLPMGAKVMNVFELVARPPETPHRFLFTAKEGALFDIWASCISAQGYYEFRLKCVKAQTNGETEWKRWLRKRELELLMETGVGEVSRVED